MMGRCQRGRSSALEQRFARCWLAVGGPPLLREWRFDLQRMWRFDFAHLETRMAIEVEGGQWSGGRHSRGKGFANDCEKYNAAVLAGWRVIRLTGDMVGVAWCERLAEWMQRGGVAANLERITHHEGSAGEVVRVVADLVGNPINRRLAALFFGGGFSLGWDARQSKLVMVEKAKASSRGKASA